MDNCKTGKFNVYYAEEAATAHTWLISCSQNSKIHQKTEFACFLHTMTPASARYICTDIFSGGGGGRTGGLRSRCLQKQTLAPNGRSKDQLMLSLQVFIFGLSFSSDRHKQSFVIVPPVDPIFQAQLLPFRAPAVPGSIAPWSLLQKRALFGGRHR